MALVRNFEASVFAPNKIGLNWDLPLDFNNGTDEIIVTRTITHYPVELFNADFPTRATDSRPVEIFRGSTIVGLNTGTISVTDNVLTDTSASFSTTPPLIGRFLRDNNSQLFRIISNTSTSLTLSGSPANGVYVILPDFTNSERAQENYELDIRTTAGPGFVKDLVITTGSARLVKTFIQDELTNLIFKDGNGTKFIVKSNTADTVFFFGSAIPLLGVGMSMLTSNFDSQLLPYVDTFKNQQEADLRVGSNLLDNTYYYYTVFSKPAGANVAQAEFGQIDSGTPTQAVSISPRDRDFGNLLYNLWPSLHRELDITGDLQDLMAVFGNFLNELHSEIDTFILQDPDKTLVTALLSLSEQTGLPSVGYTIGADTLRRIARELIGCWKLKGSKEGIARFIRVITTWDITNGTGDVSGSISDFLPNVSALRFFDPNLGSLNTRITQTDPFVAGGRFAKSLPGIVIPGFFTFREFVITIPNVALYVGTSESFSVNSGTTIMTDTSNNFGANNSLVGNFLIPNTDEPNDIFKIVANTSNSITVQGIINNRSSGGKYAVLSPLNTNRFVILNKLLPVYIPFKTKAGFIFTIS